MQFRNTTLAVAVFGAALIAGTTPGLAQKKNTKCSSILAVCMQRAQGHADICEDMYQSALANGYWQATQEPNGTQHPAIPCTK